MNNIKLDLLGIKKDELELFSDEFSVLTGPGDKLSKHPGFNTINFSDIDFIEFWAKLDLISSITGEIRFAGIHGFNRDLQLSLWLRIEQDGSQTICAHAYIAKFDPNATPKPGVKKVTKAETFPIVEINTIDIQSKHLFNGNFHHFFYSLQSDGLYLSLDGGEFVKLLSHDFKSSENALENVEYALIGDYYTWDYPPKTKFEGDFGYRFISDTWNDHALMTGEATSLRLLKYKGNSFAKLKESNKNIVSDLYPDQFELMYLSEPDRGIPQSMMILPIHENYRLNHQESPVNKFDKVNIKLSEIGAIEYWIKVNKDDLPVNLLTINGTQIDLISGQKSTLQGKFTFSFNENNELVLQYCTYNETAEITKTDYVIQHLWQHLNGNFHHFSFSFENRTDQNGKNYIEVYVTINGSKYSFVPPVGNNSIHDLSEPSIYWGQTENENKHYKTLFTSPRIWKPSDSLTEVIQNSCLKAASELNENYFLFRFSDLKENQGKGLSGESIDMEKFPSTILRAIQRINQIVPINAPLHLKKNTTTNRLESGAGFVEFWIKPDLNYFGAQELVTFSSTFSSILNIAVQKIQHDSNQAELIVNYRNYDIKNNIKEDKWTHSSIHFPSQLFNGNYHHISLKFDYPESTLIYQANVSLSVNGSQYEPVTNNALGMNSIKDIFIGQKDTYHNRYNSWFAGVRIWSYGIQEENNELIDSREKELDEKSVNKLKTLDNLYFYINPEDFKRYLLPKNGQSSDFFSAESHAPTEIQRVIVGNKKISLADVQVIDLWVKIDGSQQTGKHCVFELSDGVSIGNLFGLYIECTNLSENPVLYLRKNRAELPFTEKEGIAILEKNKFHYITLIIKKSEDYHELISFGEFNVHVLINGVIYNTKSPLSIDVMDDFPLEFISVGKDLDEGSKFTGKIIGPRIWNNRNYIELEALPYHLKSYAYMDFYSDEIFGADLIRDDVYGKLIGNIRKVQYTVSNRKKIQTTEDGKTLTKVIVEYEEKTEHSFYLNPSYSKKNNFYTNGIQFETNKSPILNDFKESELISKLKMGERNYPIEIKKKLVAHPQLLYFTDIQTIDLWIRPDTIAKSANNQTLFEITGHPDGNFAVSGIAIELNNARKAFIVKKSFIDREPEYVEFLVESEFRSIPNLWNGNFHHLCIQVGNDTNELSWKIRINGLDPFFVGNSRYLEFDFTIESIFVSSDNKGNNILHGKMCGPRFWSGEEWNNRTLNQAAFTDFSIDPKHNQFRHTRELGRVAIPDLTQEDMKEYLEKQKVSKLLQGEVIHRSYFPRKKVSSTNINNYIGIWASTTDETKIPVQHSGDPDSEWAIEKHCVYKCPTYIGLHYITDHRQICLINHHGDIFRISYLNDQKAEFINDKGEHACTTYFLLADVPESNIIANKDVPKKVRKLRIEFKDVSVPSGIYKTPYRKLSSGRGANMGNIFQHRPPNFNSLLVGYDITKIDPLAIDKHGASGNPIFRMPPSESYWVEVVQGMAIPFGWNMIPFASFQKNTIASLLKTADDLDNQIGISSTFEYDSKDSIGGGLKTPYGSLGGNHTGALSSMTNRENALRRKNFIERQLFSSLERWHSSTHDIILDRTNVLFDGQISEFDNASEFDFGAGFLPDLNGLKGPHENEAEVYLDFIKKYGTHFLSSARFGSKGFKYHHFNIDITNKLANNTVKLSFNKKTSESNEGKGGAEYKKVGVDFSGSHSFTDSNGQGLQDQDQIDISNEYKKEEEEIMIFGSNQEGLVDQLGANAVMRHFEPIYQLLNPPCFSDLELITEVRSKLQHYTNTYIKNEELKYPKAEFYNQKENVELYITPPNYFGPSEKEILTNPKPLVNPRGNLHGNKKYVEDPTSLGIPVRTPKAVAEIQIDITINGQKETFKLSYNGTADLPDIHKKTFTLIFKEVKSAAKLPVTPIDLEVIVEYEASYSFWIDYMYSAILQHLETTSRSMGGYAQGQNNTVEYEEWVNDKEPTIFTYQTEKTTSKISRKTIKKSFLKMVGTEQIKINDDALEIVIDVSRQE